jgi:integrase
VPIPLDVVTQLRQLRAAAEWHEDDDLVFPSRAGSAMLPENLHRRSLKPTAEEAGVGWAGLHTFRHSSASMLIAESRNIVQVSWWFGHHSASLTLDAYAHLMDNGAGAQLDLPGVTAGSHSGSRDSSVGMDPDLANRYLAGLFPDRPNHTEQPEGNQ